MLSDAYCAVKEVIGTIFSREFTIMGSKAVIAICTGIDTHQNTIQSKTPIACAPDCVSKSDKKMILIIKIIGPNKINDIRFTVDMKTSIFFPFVSR